MSYPPVSWGSIYGQHPPWKNKIKDGRFGGRETPPCPQRRTVMCSLCKAILSERKTQREVWRQGWGGDGAFRSIFPFWGNRTKDIYVGKIIHQRTYYFGLEIQWETSGLVCVLFCFFLSRNRQRFHWILVISVELWRTGNQSLQTFNQVSLQCKINVVLKVLTVKMEKTALAAEGK